MLRSGALAAVLFERLATYVRTYICVRRARFVQFVIKMAATGEADAHAESTRCMYFSFASNMSSWRIKLNAPSATFYKTARLEDYELQFRSKSRSQPFDGEWKGGKANVVSKNGSSVWGVVWSVSRDEITAMHDEEPGYNSLQVTVVCADGQKVECYIFMHPDNPPFDPSVDRPSPQYLQCIIDGAKECNLPESYVTELEKVQHNGYSGEVEVRRPQES